MKKSTATGLAVAGILTGGAVYGYKKTMEYFFNMALERETKHFKVRAEEEGPYSEIVLTGEGKMLSFPCEHVYTKSFDGLKLHARLYKQDGAKRTVILVHGWRGGWNYDFCLGGPWLHDEGYNLLVIDQRAQGESEGQHMTMGILERKDCHTWLKWLEEHTDLTEVPVYFMGISMGASTVLMATGDPMPSYVKGIIADCGYTTPYDMFYHYGHSHFHIPMPVMDVFNKHCIKTAGIDLKSYSTLEAMKTNETPIFFVHGKGDTFVPMEMTMETYEACKAPKQLLLVDDAPHAMSFLFGTEEYTTKALAFFDECEA